MDLSLMNTGPAPHPKSQARFTPASISQSHSGRSCDVSQALPIPRSRGPARTPADGDPASRNSPLIRSAETCPDTHTMTRGSAPVAQGCDGSELRRRRAVGGGRQALSERSVPSGHRARRLGHNGKGPRDRHRVRRPPSPPPTPSRQWRGTTGARSRRGPHADLRGGLRGPSALLRSGAGPGAGLAHASCLTPRSTRGSGARHRTPANPLPH